MTLQIKSLLAIFVFVTQLAVAQTTLKLQANPELKVTGTSSLHDWEMKSNQATGELQVTTDENGLVAINSLTVSLQAESIKSGKSGMDKKAYEALKTDKNKSIKYVVKSASKTADTWTLNGVLSVAGTTKSLTIKAKESHSAGVYTFAGSQAFKLTDFGIEPPKAMMGTIKTGDEVTVHFNVKFK